MMSFTTAALLRPILFFLFLFGCSLPLSCYAAHHQRATGHHQLTHRKRKARQQKPTHRHTPSRQHAKATHAPALTHAHSHVSHSAHAVPHSHTHTGHHAQTNATHHASHPHRRHAEKHAAKSAHLKHHLRKHIDKIRIAKRLVVRKAIGQLGKPYVYGGSSPRTGFDCSGLVYFIYDKMFTPHLPRTANNMFHMRSASRVRRGQLETGDLVFFHIHSPQHSHADHVGIYLGNNRFIEAPHTGSRIRISHLDNDYWRKHYLGARRLLETAKISLPPQLHWE